VLVLGPWDNGEGVISHAAAGGGMLGFKAGEP
jgi:hypothetical protein